MHFDLYEELRKGYEYHKAGELNKAERIYKRILQENPYHSETLNLYGTLAHQVHKDDIAISLISKAIEHNSGNHLYHDNLAEIMLSRQRFNEAIESCQRSLKLRPDNSVTLIRMGLALKGKEKTDEALSFFHKALQIKPDSASAHFHIGKSLQDLGSQKEAIKSFCNSLDCDPTFHPAHIELAHASLPGDDYRTLLQRFHEWLQPKTYIEVGVSNGKSLALVQPQTIAIGIDPSPKVPYKLSNKTKIFKMPSDDFFSSHNLFEEFEKQPIELAFIDGLHIFEQALKDFINIERYALQNSVILIHDCLPLDQITSSRTRKTAFWSGDVWKLITCLKKYRQDLELFTIATYPTGLGVITNLNPESTFLEKSFDQIVNEFIRHDYTYLEEDRNEKLNVVSNDWALITERLGNILSS